MIRYARPVHGLVHGDTRARARHAHAARVHARMQKHTKVQKLREMVHATCPMARLFEAAGVKWEETWVARICYNMLIRYNYYV